MVTEDYFVVESGTFATLKAILEFYPEVLVNDKNMNNQVFENILLFSNKKETLEVLNLIGRNNQSQNPGPASTRNSRKKCFALCRKSYAKSSTVSATTRACGDRPRQPNKAAPPRLRVPSQFTSNRWVIWRRPFAFYVGRSIRCCPLRVNAFW